MTNNGVKYILIQIKTPCSLNSVQPSSERSGLSPRLQRYQAISLSKNIFSSDKPKG